MGDGNEQFCGRARMEELRQKPNGFGANDYQQALRSRYGRGSALALRARC